jgi:hypothetical protein
MAGGAFETVEVPFITVGNHQVLTAEQLANAPWLEDFVKRFPTCFEWHPVADYLIFYPDGDAHNPYSS